MYSPFVSTCDDSSTPRCWFFCPPLVPHSLRFHRSREVRTWNLSTRDDVWAHRPNDVRCSDRVLKFSVRIETFSWNYRSWWSTSDISIRMPTFSGSHVLVWSFRIDLLGICSCVFISLVSIFGWQNERRPHSNIKRTLKDSSASYFDAFEHCVCEQAFPEEVSWVEEPVSNP